MKTWIWTTLMLMLLSLTSPTTTATATTAAETTSPSTTAAAATPTTTAAATPLPPPTAAATPPLTSTTDQPTTITQDTPRISLTSTNNSPTVGSSVTLTCQAQGSDNIALMQWYGPRGVYINFESKCFQAGQSTHITYISVTCGGGNSVLTINSFDPGRDAGSWSCTDYFSNSAFITLTAVASNVENIQITADLAFLNHFDTISLLYGEKDTIYCSADCQNGCQFTWHLDDQVVSLSNELVIDLQSSPPTPGGIYMCTASSGGDSLTKNVTIKSKSRDTIIFSPSDDILNVNEGDNVTVICDGKKNDWFCSFVECTDSRYTMSTSHELKFYDIALDKTGRYYCMHEMYERFFTANEREIIYRSIQINVIASSPSTSSTTATTTATTTEQPTTTTQARSTSTASTTTPLTTTEQPATTTQASSTSTASTTTAATIPSTTTEQKTITTQDTPEISLTSTNNSPTVGSSVTLTCQAPGSEYDEIIWNGPTGVFIIFAPYCFRLSEAESTHITYIYVTCGGGTSVLTINNFDPGRDAGEWLCTRYSWFGTSESASITLTAASSNVANIQITAEIAFIDYYDTISLLYGEKETINCSADCQNGCQFTWHLGNQIVSSSNKLVIDLQSSPPTLGGGRYMCTASSGGDSLTKNVSINERLRESIVFLPPDDILNVNEGDNVTVICDGMNNNFGCYGLIGIECTDSWDTIFSTAHELKFNNIALDKTGRYYCIHEWYEQTSNVRDKIYRSVQINVIASSPSTALTTTTATTTGQPTTTTQVMTTGSTTTATTTEQPNTTTQELTPTSILTSTSTSDAAPSTSDAAPSTSYAATSTSDAAPTMLVTSSVSVTTSYTSIITSLSSTSLTTTSVGSGSITSLQVVSSSDPQLIQEGSELTLTCQADCQPVDSCVYTWNFNDNIIANTKECQMINITRQATGTYTCSASNGQTMSDAIDVKVNYPPSAMTITRNPDVSTYNVQSTITLTCNVDCVPKATITWAKGSQVLQVSNTFNYLSLSNVLTGDSGEYTCIADNGIGNQMTATTSISIKYILYGGSGASSIHWVFLHKILLMVVIISILQ